MIKRWFVVGCKCKFDSWERLCFKKVDKSQLGQTPFSCALGLKREEGNGQVFGPAGNSQEPHTGLSDSVTLLWFSFPNCVISHTLTLWLWNKENFRYVFAYIYSCGLFNLMITALGLFFVVFVALGMDPRASGLQGKYSTTDLQIYPWLLWERTKATNLISVPETLVLFF